MKKRQPPKKEDQRPGSADSNPRDLFPDTLPPRQLPIFPDPGSIKEAALLALVAGPTRQSGFKHFLKNDGWAILSREVSELGRIVAEYTLDYADKPTRDAAALYRSRKGVA